MICLDPWTPLGRPHWTIEDCKSCASGEKLSCEHPLLQKVPLQNIIMDELYLMPRISGSVHVHVLCIILFTSTKNNYVSPCIWKIEQKSINIELFFEMADRPTILRQHLKKYTEP